MDILKVKVNNEWVAIPSITGQRGIGIQSITKTNTQGLVDTYTILFSDGNSTTFNISNGAVPSFTIGTVTEGPTAAVTVTGTNTNPVLNLTLPNANVPTAVSELSNDAGYATESYVNTAISNVNTMKIHICTAAEYNSGTGIPTIASPDTQTFYLVPGGEGSNLFIEWAYVNGAWERFGSADVDLSNYVQKTDYATGNDAGVVKVDSTYGIGMLNGYIRISPASIEDIKSGVNNAKTSSVAKQHISTFYGLATAAGDSTQSASANAVGTYTEEAKAAIQAMLDVPSTADVSNKADKADTVLDTTLSRGRKDNTTVGAASLAFGVDAEASGYYSVALGLNTTAASQGAFAEGKGTTAHYIAHAEGENTEANGQWSHSEGVDTIANGAASHAGGDNTIANGHSSFVTGRYNVADSYDNWPFWAANTSYSVGDKVKREQLVNNEATIVGYICKEANTDESFDISHWDFDVHHMNFAAIVGNGYEAEDPTTHEMVRHGSNAYALDWSGNGRYMGDVYVHANADSSGGVKVATINDVPVQDVQINGTSILSNGVANVPIANNETPGVIKYTSGYGLTLGADNILKLSAAGAADVKAGSSSYKPIVTARQHDAAFYGLAKAAGDSTQAASANAVGTYTDNAKASIQHMLGTDTNLASYESDTTADQAYAIGELFMLNGKLHQATAAIAIGDTLTVGTNCTVVNAAGVFTRDVQVNGTSVVSGGVANVPIAKRYNNDGGALGVVSIGQGLMLTAAGMLFTDYATTTATKNGTGYYQPITPVNQHASAFYGLAKASGDTTQSASSNAVGVYTDNAKASIKSMLGIVDGSTGTVDITGTTPTITAVENTRYVCGEVSTLSFTPAASGTCIVRFTSGSTATVLTLPSTVKFPEWFDATALEADTIYELCVTDGIYGAVMSWAL